MVIFLILAPYGTFAALMLLTSTAVSLFASAVICLAAMAYDIARGRSVKILSAGSAILFAALGFYVTLVDSGWSVSGVKLAVDAGLLAISLLSIVIRRPFTLQYAREVVDAKTAAFPGFMRVNYILSAAWALAFLLMVMANVLLIYVPGLPLWSGILIAFAARNTALYFTKWYPEYERAKYPTPAAGVLSIS
jgi:hypothetical protein